MKGATIIYREGCKEDHEEIERKKTVENAKVEAASREKGELYIPI
jgi:hypothetical protein